MPDKAGILFLGDIVGHPGRRALQRFLPQLVRKYAPTIVIANGENAAGGIGITEEIGRDLFLQVDVLTSGNHIWDKKEALPYLEREPRLLRPANYPAGNPGRGSYIFQDGGGVKIAVLNLQGRVFMEAIDCPFRRADAEVEALRQETPGHRRRLPRRGDLGEAGPRLAPRRPRFGRHRDPHPCPDRRREDPPRRHGLHHRRRDGRRLPLGHRHPEGAGPAEVPHWAGRRGSSRPRKGLVLSAVFVKVDAGTGRALSIKREILVEEDSDEE